MKFSFDLPLELTLNISYVEGKKSLSRFEPDNFDDYTINYFEIACPGLNMKTDGFCRWDLLEGAIDSLISRYVSLNMSELIQEEELKKLNR